MPRLRVIRWRLVPPLIQVLDSIPVHGIGPGGDAVPGPAPHWLRALEGSWER
jgi:hypothetical protein